MTAIMGGARLGFYTTAGEQESHGHAPFVSGPARAIGSLLLASAIFAPPAAAQSTHRYEATDPNASGEEAKAAPAAEAPRPARSSPRVLRVVRPGLIHAEANVESAAPVMGGGEAAVVGGVSAGAKDKSPGANPTRRYWGGSKGDSAGPARPIAPPGPGGSAKPPKQGIRVVDANKNPIASGSFYDTETVYFQIFGYEENDTLVCLESLTMKGNLLGDCVDFMKPHDAAAAISYNNGKFTYANGIWEARFKSIYRYDTLRISVTNSKGEKSVKTFNTTGSHTHPSPMSRHFVNGKVKNSPYAKGEIVEVHVFGFDEKDAHVCTQMRDDATHADIAVCSPYEDFSGFKKLPGQNWSYQNGAWVKKFNTTTMRQDTTYYVRLRSSKNVELAVMLQLMSNPPGFVVGPN